MWHVCGISGSLRRASYNRAVLRAAAEMVPGGLTIDIFEGLADVPHFNRDVEAEGDPAGVAALKGAIRHADALLIATPEYNGGVPGVLKNALDWASRKGTDEASVLTGKPVAVMGASPGRLGTARAQPQLRQTLAGAGAIVMPKPEVHLMSIGGQVTDGVLVDEAVRRVISSLVESLAEWIPRIQE